jgi:oligopeptide/dipeptide ABC transporter ATP-binding protein
VSEGLPGAAAPGAASGQAAPVQADRSVVAQAPPLLLQAEQVRKLFPLKAHGSLLPWRTARVPMLHAVDGVDLTIGTGESVGLVGESGCGKSTLVRLITRTLDLTAGAIHFHGEDIGRIPASAFARVAQRKRIQMVFQDPTDSLNPRYTARDTIAEPLRLLGGLSGAALSARIEAVAALVQMPEELLGRFPHQLSGGQKARVGIARAIALEPSLLILDEPTAALDVSVQAVILHLLADLKQKLGMSYLFVSHDLNIVRLLCDRVMVMYLGRIVESGPARQVFESPRHPYTRALLSAIPGLSGGAARRIRLEGDPTSPVDPDPDRCRFHGRCPKGVDACARSSPALVELGPAHFAACHFPERP